MRPSGQLLATTIRSPKWHRTAMEGRKTINHDPRKETKTTARKKSQTQHHLVCSQISVLNQTDLKEICLPWHCDENEHFPPSSRGTWSG